MYVNSVNLSYHKNSLIFSSSEAFFSFTSGFFFQTTLTFDNEMDGLFVRHSCIIFLHRTTCTSDDVEVELFTFYGRKGI